MVMLGHCGFHDPPNAGLLELGYTVLEQHRRQGYASEAIRLGFDRVGEQMDSDDGLELLYATISGGYLMSRSSRCRTL
jgi:RimJ/RimL family protein N-acetyltransferase